jgi:predicted small lipoprotein YifL
LKTSLRITLMMVLATLTLAGCGQFIPDQEPETAPIPADILNRRTAPKTPSAATQQSMFQAVHGNRGKYGEISTLTVDQMLSVGHTACLRMNSGESFGQVTKVIAQAAES